MQKWFDQRSEHGQHYCILELLLYYFSLLSGSDCNIGSLFSSSNPSKTQQADSKTPKQIYEFMNYSFLIKVLVYNDLIAVSTLFHSFGFDSMNEAGRMTVDHALSAVNYFRFFSFLVQVLAVPTFYLFSSIC